MMDLVQVLVQVLVQFLVQFLVQVLVRDLSEITAFSKLKHLWAC